MLGILFIHIPHPAAGGLVHTSEWPFICIIRRADPHVPQKDLVCRVATIPAMAEIEALEFTFYIEANLSTQARSCIFVAHLEDIEERASLNDRLPVNCSTIDTKWSRGIKRSWRARI